MDLAWDPPARDGGAPITGYIIEKKDKYSTDWVPVKEVEGNLPKAKVTGLNEGDKYEFRVRAVNKAGPGEPSQATSPHLAKPKNRKLVVFLNVFLHSVIIIFSVLFMFGYLNDIFFLNPKTYRHTDWDPKTYTPDQKHIDIYRYTKTQSIKHTQI